MMLSDIGRRFKIGNPETGTFLSICGLINLRDAVESTCPDLVISICDPDESIWDLANMSLENHGGLRLDLAFHDVDRIRPGTVAPTLHDITRVADMIKTGLPDGGHLLVHCSAGVSRSPAIAMLAMSLVAERQEIPADYADAALFLQILLASPATRPNTRILRIAEEIEPALDGRLTAMAESFAKAARRAS